MHCSWFYRLLVVFRCFRHCCYCCCCCWTSKVPYRSWCLQLMLMLNQNQLTFIRCNNFMRFNCIYTECCWSLSILNIQQAQWEFRNERKKNEINRNSIQLNRRCCSLIQFSSLRSLEIPIREYMETMYKLVIPYINYTWGIDVSSHFQTNQDDYPLIVNKFNVKRIPSLNHLPLFFSILST